MALGIGVSTAIFAFFSFTAQPGGAGIRLMDAVQDPATYVSIDRTSATSQSEFSLSEYRYFRDRATTVSEISAESEPTPLVLGVISNAWDADAVVARFASANFLSIRGFQPVLGRTFSVTEEQAGAPVALLSYWLWQHRFAEDQEILGSTILLNNHAVTIIGIADKRMHPNVSFVFLPLGLQPLLLNEGDGGSESEKTWLMVNARLRPRVAVSQVQAEADLLAAEFDRGKPTVSQQAATPRQTSNRVLVFKGTVPPAILRQTVEIKLGVAVAASMILLIACSNLASLLLARATVRQREIGIRLSLGASRSRIVSQLLTESLLLSTAGGVLGILFASWLAKWLFVFSANPNGLDFHFDYSVLLYASFLSFVTGVSFGVGPALAATKTDLARALRAEGLVGTPTSPVGSAWSRRNLLVVIPLAASLMLLIGATLLLRGGSNVRAVSTSFDTSHLIEMSFRLKAQGYDQAKTLQFQQTLRDRISALPGVASVALSNSLAPLLGSCLIQIEGSAVPSNDPLACDTISDGFFETISVPILRGREFLPSDRDGSIGVTIISQDVAEKYWPDQNPLGKRIRPNRGDAFFEIVGVAANLGDPRNPGLISVLPTIYIPHSQSFLWASAEKSGMTSRPNSQADREQLIVRASGDPDQVKASLRQVVRATDPSLWVNIRTIEEKLAAIMGPIQPQLYIVSGLGVLVLLMASVGIYALLAYSVSQRTREIGIRMALGARKLEILLLVMRRTLILIAWGIAIGLIAALALGRIVATLVLHTEPPDAATSISVALVLSGTSVLASYLPACKALRVNPVEALRCE